MSGRQGEKNEEPLPPLGPSPPPKEEIETLREALREQEIKRAALEEALRKRELEIIAIRDAQEKEAAAAAAAETTAYSPQGPRESQFNYPNHLPISRSIADTTTIGRVSERLRSGPAGLSVSDPTIVAIGPYHRHLIDFQQMEDAKSAAMDEFCKAAKQTSDALREKFLELARPARMCYDMDDFTVRGIDHPHFAHMMLLDGCFLLQFMAEMCRDPDDPEEPAGPLMSRPEVHRHIDAIARDLLLFENQIPWLVLRALLEMRPAAVPVVSRFLDRMGTAFHAGNDPVPSSTLSLDQLDEPPMHLLGLFHRRLVGKPEFEDLAVPTLSSVTSTAVELAEMGVKLAAGKTKEFGKMAMAKRVAGPGLYLFGQLSLSPMVLTDLSACWLLNMAAYEQFLGATQADNFAVSSYVSLIALLVNREEDVQELRGKGIVRSAMSDEATLAFYKWASPRLRVGYRYYEVFKQLQEYKQERWVWMAVHGFVYRNIKTIIAVLSGIGVLVGLFKAILSLKQPSGK
ncbi:hypothetical protein ACP70R_028394 [Stipagrostis hirtigluma subsp. patula]